MDVTSIESFAATQQALIARLPRVDVLVNNAAVLLGENDDPFSIAGRYRAGAPVPAKFFSHGPA